MESIFILSCCTLSLLFMAGFFSAAETAITASSEAKMMQLSSQGNKKADLVLKLIRDKERMIGAILLANNALNVLSSSIVAMTLVKFFGEEGLIISTFVMTILIFIFAEVLPKIYAFDNPEKVSLAIAPVIAVVVKICSPITYTIQWLGEKLMTFLNLRNKDSIISGNEALRGAIALSHKEGSVIKSDKDMLGGILDLSDVTVEQIMVHRSDMQSICIDLPIEEIIKQTLDCPHSRIPIWQDNPDNIIGILHIKNLLRAIHNNKSNLEEIKLIDFVKEPWFIPNTTLLRDQLQQFRKKRNHFALVIDEYNVLMGLVTLEDILEEIVGQIDDEYDIAKENITKVAENEFIVYGSTNIRDLNRDLELHLPDHNANTIAGLIMFETEKMPDEMEIVNIHGIEAQILKKRNNQIMEIKIRLNQQDNIE